MVAEKKVLRELFPHLRPGSLVYIVNTDFRDQNIVEHHLGIFSRYSTAPQHSVDWVQFYVSRCMPVVPKVEFGGKYLVQVIVNEKERVFGAADQFYVGKREVVAALDGHGFGEYADIVQRLKVR